MAAAQEDLHSVVIDPAIKGLIEWLGLNMVLSWL
jgi:hypothetical protein